VTGVNFAYKSSSTIESMFSMSTCYRWIESALFVQRTFTSHLNLDHDFWEGTTVLNQCSGWMSINVVSKFKVFSHCIKVFIDSIAYHLYVAFYQLISWLHFIMHIERYLELLKFMNADVCTIKKMLLVKAFIM